MVRQGARHGHGAAPGDTPEPPSLAKRLQAVLRSPLPRAHKHVLLALLAYARPDLTVYHAQSQLATELDYSKTYIREILTHLTACQILGVVGTPRQHYATEYAIDLGHLPDRPLGLWRMRDRAPHAETSGQSETELSSEQEGTRLPSEQGVTQLPPERNPVAPRGQLSEPQSNQRNTEERKVLSKEMVKAIAVRPASPRAGAKISAPEKLPITEELRGWMATHVRGLLEVSGFDLPLEVQRCLQYHRAHKPTVRYPLAQWYEVVKVRLLWLYQQARARGKLPPAAARAPARASPEAVPSHLRPPPSGDDCLSVEQVRALVADFLRPRTLPRTRIQEDRHRRYAPQGGDPCEAWCEARHGAAGPWPDPGAQPGRRPHHGCRTEGAQRRGHRRGGLPDPPAGGTDRHGDSTRAGAHHRAVRHASGASSVDVRGGRLTPRRDALDRTDIDEQTGRDGGGRRDGHHDARTTVTRLQQQEGMMAVPLCQSRAHAGAPVVGRSG